jgi:hypothetical protein
MCSLQLIESIENFLPREDEKQDYNNKLFLDYA